MQNSDPDNPGSDADGSHEGRRPSLLTDAEWSALINQMTRHARRAMHYVRKGTGDYDDAVISALRTYLRQVQDGQTPLSDDPDNIWPLLEKHLKRKLDKFRHQQRYATNNFRRDGDLADQAINSAAFLDRNRSPEDIERYILDALQTLSELIDDKLLLQIARLKLESYTTAEIATITSLSQHQVRRRISKIQRLLNSPQPAPAEDSLDE